MTGLSNIKTMFTVKIQRNSILKYQVETDLTLVSNIDEDFNKKKIIYNKF